MINGFTEQIEKKQKFDSVLIGAFKGLCKEMQNIETECDKSSEIVPQDSLKIKNVCNNFLLLTQSRKSRSRG